MVSRPVLRTVTVMAGFGLVILLALPAGPIEERHRQVERRVAVGGRTVYLTSSSADIHVRFTSRDELAVTAAVVLSSRDDEWLEAAAARFDVVLTQSPDRLELSFPSDWRRPPRGGFLEFGFQRQSDLRLELELPSDVRLEINNRRGGDLEVSWPSALPTPAFEMKSRYGHIRSELPGESESSDRGERFTAAASAGNEAGHLDFTVSSGDIWLRRE